MFHLINKEQKDQELQLDKIVSIDESSSQTSEKIQTKDYANDSDKNNNEIKSQEETSNQEDHFQNDNEYQDLTKAEELRQQQRFLAEADEKEQQYYDKLDALGRDKINQSESDYENNLNQENLEFGLENKENTDNEQERKQEIEEDEALELDVFDQAREIEMDMDQIDPGLAQQIEEHENKLIQKKDWQMKGEVQSHQRPVNSLLEQVLEFQIKQKAEEPITIEFQNELEAIIKQRILDEAWDDVMQYEKPKVIQENFNTLQEIDFEKAKKGLGELYEEDYKADVFNLPKPKKEDSLKKEILELYQELSYTLDVLTNLNFTPKISDQPANIIKNISTIQVEEKIPIFVNNQNQMAPQEMIKKKEIKKYVISLNFLQKLKKNKIELSTEEKQRQHRRHKARKRKWLKAKQKKNLENHLLAIGETKYLHNLKKKGQAELKQAVKRKNQKSISFKNTSSFFKDLEQQKAGLNNQNLRKPIKKAKNYKL